MTIRASLEAIRDEAAKALAELPPPTSDRRRVNAGAHLQGELDQGGAMQLEDGAIFEGPFEIRKSGTDVAGLVTLTGLNGAPALTVLPGAHDVTVAGLVGRSSGGAVFVIGAFDETQTKTEDAPRRVRFILVGVPGHQGKRAFEIHGADVTLDQCAAADVWDPAGRDSQAIWIGNAPGPVTVKGGTFSAGSEVVLVGGAPPTIPGLIPQQLLFEGVELYRPLSWKTDGTFRKVKNLFELKSGKGVVLKNSKLHGCWANGQAGEAIMLTPTIDGSRTDPPQVSHVSDVRIEDTQIYDCGSILNVTGRDNTSYTPEATSIVVLRRVTGVASRAKFGGRGQVCIAGVEVDSLTIEDSVFVVDGSSTIYTHLGGHVNASGVSTADLYAVKQLIFQRNVCGIVGQYGINLEGYANAAKVPSGHTFVGNTFGGGTVQRGVSMGNVFLAAAAFNALESVVEARKLGG